MVNEERVGLLVAALRSGEYSRGNGYLHIGDTWCCLGVATDVAIRHGLAVTRESRPGNLFGAREEFGGHPGEMLCPQVQDWYGFDTDDPALRAGQGDVRSASEWNDEGAPGEDNPREDFTDIADAFERTYLAGEK